MDPVRRLQLHEILKNLDGVVDAYFQEPTVMEYPCVRYEPAVPSVQHADNIKFQQMDGYTVFVIDRNPDSLIPAQVEGLRYSKFERYYRASGLHHFVFLLFF